MNLSAPVYLWLYSIDELLDVLDPSCKANTLGSALEHSDRLSNILAICVVSYSKNQGAKAIRCVIDSIVF